MMFREWVGVGREGVVKIRSLCWVSLPVSFWCLAQPVWNVPGFLEVTWSQGTRGAHIPAFHRDLSTPANVRLVYLYWGPPRAFLVAQMVKNLPAMQEGSISGSGRSPGEGNGNPVFLPGKCCGQRSLAGYCSWDGKESDTTEQLTLSMCQALLWAPQEGDEPLPHDNSVFWKDTC